MMRLNEKAVSDIVSTVLIIMIAVAAVGIIGAVVVPLVRDNLSAGTLCSEAMGDLVMSSSSGISCFDNDQEVIAVQITRGAKDIEYLGVKIFVISEGNSYPFTINSSFGKNSAETVYLNTTVFDSVDEIEVYPIILVNGKEKVCGKSSSLILEKCNLASSLIESVIVHKPNGVQQNNDDDGLNTYYFCFDNDNPTATGSSLTQSSYYIKGVTTILRYLAGSPFSDNQFISGSSSTFILNIPSGYDITRTDQEDGCYNQSELVEYYCSSRDASSISNESVPVGANPGEICMDGRIN